MLAIVAPLIVFGLVIFVHELGHFVAAKLLGVYAPRFSIGFGPTLFKRRRGETEYVLAALPLGGYVRMASRHDEAAAALEGGSEEASALAADDPDYDPEAMLPFGPKPVPEHRWFESKPLWARLIILLAGVAMNVLLTFVVATGLAMHYGRAIYPTTVIGTVDSVAWAPAFAASLRHGDTIRTVDGAPVATWNAVLERIGKARADSLVMTTSRGRVALATRGDEDRLREVAAAIAFHQPAVIGGTIAGRAAEKAGLRAGDSVVAIDGVPVTGWAGMVDRVTASAGRELAMTVRRGGQTLELRVTPEASEEPDPASGKVVRLGRIGASAPDIATREPVGLIDGLRSGWNGTWAWGGTIITFVRGLFAGDVSPRQLGGPIAITRASVQAAQGGLADLVALIGLLSINVAILNLLPIPILDGGQVLLNVAESVKGSPFSLRTREYILRVGLAAIGLLFVLVMFNDIASLVGRLFG